MSVESRDSWPGAGPQGLEAQGYRLPDRFTLADVEMMRAILHGTSVIDWHRIALPDAESVREFLKVHELDVDVAEDQERMEQVKREAIAYLQNNFDFPVPGAVRKLTVPELLSLAAGRGHRQFCACVILKVVHIIHHLQGRELLVMLPMSDAEVFRFVEEKVYRVVGEMMGEDRPVSRFLGGRKHRDSLYTKLLSKRESIAAQIYDKLRFRVIVRTPEDLAPTLNFLSRKLFPFNYVIPGESKNNLIHLRKVARGAPAMNPLLDAAQGEPEPLEAEVTLVDNKFSAPSYRVVHFVVDLPVRVPRSVFDRAPPAARGLGRVVFVLAEFQIVDESTAVENEAGEASHAQYKERQKRAVMERLRMGFRGSRPRSDEPTTEHLMPPRDPED